jgi:hypothetical protein
MGRTDGMDHDGLDALVTRGGDALSAGPLALILAEDGAELDSTVVHHMRLGFGRVILFLPPGLDPPPAAASDRVVTVGYPTMAEGALPEAVTAVAQAAPAGTWIYHGYNAEYLFFPFCDSRSVGEMLDFHAEERRTAMVAVIVDLYASDLHSSPDAVSVDGAHLDAAGYYARGREDPRNGWRPKDRQLDIHGGLRWRFEDHVPHERRRIDRVALFQARRGLRLGADHLLNDEEMNTIACPWHHNLTAAVCSFRAAKALRANPGSRAEIDSFMWRNSVPFDWSPQQLLDLGLMEPGQWF